MGCDARERSRAGGTASIAGGADRRGAAASRPADIGTWALNGVAPPGQDRFAGRQSAPAGGAVRTLIVSDLHLGSAGGVDLLRRPELREPLLEAGARRGPRGAGGRRAGAAPRPAPRCAGGGAPLLRRARPGARGARGRRVRRQPRPRPGRAVAGAPQRTPRAGAARRRAADRGDARSAHPLRDGGPAGAVGGPGASDAPRTPACGCAPTCTSPTATTSTATSRSPRSNASASARCAGCCAARRTRSRAPRSTRRS